MVQGPSPSPSPHLASTLRPPLLLDIRRRQSLPTFIGGWFRGCRFGIGTDAILIMVDLSFAATFHPIHLNE